METKKYNYARELGICFVKQLREDGYNTYEIMSLINRNIRMAFKIIKELEEDSL